jgi:hypothetical protein
MAGSSLKSDRGLCKHAGLANCLNLGKKGQSAGPDSVSKFRRRIATRQMRI